MIGKCVICYLFIRVFIVALFRYSNILKANGARVNLEFEICWENLHVYGTVLNFIVIKTKYLRLFIF